jgi:hypothetical protein
LQTGNTNLYSVGTRITLNILKWSFSGFQSQSHIATDGHSENLGVEHPPGTHIYYSLTVTVLFFSFVGALSGERTGLPFVYAAGPCQHSLSRVRVPWYSRPYITVSDSRHPFSSPPTTRRVTVEVFDAAATRMTLCQLSHWLLPDSEPISVFYTQRHRYVKHWIRNLFFWSSI